MKVCFIFPHVMQVVAGGVSIQVHKTAEALKEKGVSVTLFNPSEKYNWQEFDLAHIFRADYDTINMAQWLHESNIPFVTTPIFFNRRNHVIIRFYRTLTKLLRSLFSGIRTDLDCVYDICNYSDMVFPNTHEEKKFLITGLGIPADKIHVIPNAVETSFADSDSSLFKEKYGIEDFILSVGNFGYKRKNMLRLIDAIEMTDHKAVLIGTIYDNAYGRECRDKMNQAQNILWLDALDHSDPMLASAYAACKVFAMPSTLETPGLAAMEAALAGAAIVITPHGGPKEYFGSMAEYVKPEDTKSIAMAINRAMAQQRSPRLQQHITENYSYSAIAKMLTLQYKKIIRKK